MGMQDHRRCQSSPSGWWWLLPGPPASGCRSRDQVDRTVDQLAHTAARRSGAPSSLDDADTRDFRPLLGACADRPCNCTAAEQRDELTALHSRTSLARATNTSDKETPSDAAVFRLTAM